MHVCVFVCVCVCLCVCACACVYLHVCNVCESHVTADLIPLSLSLSLFFFFLFFSSFLVARKVLETGEGHSKAALTQSLAEQW